jgi:hypothetical protein
MHLRKGFRYGPLFTLACALIPLAHSGCQKVDPVGSGGCITTVPAVLGDTGLGITLIKPNGCETYHVGDTVPVSFEYRNAPDTFYFADLKFSYDDGKTFALPLSILHGANGGNGVRWHGSARKDTLWVIPPPDSADPSRTFVTGRARIKIEDYTKKEVMDMNDQAFTILAK